MLSHHKVLIEALREFSDIELMFNIHGGDRKTLEEKARKLSRTTTMTFRQAVEQILDEDSQIRKQPIGFLEGFTSMSFKNIKRSAYVKQNGLRVNCDGTTIKDRKPNLKIMPNHRSYVKTVRFIKAN